MQKIDVAFIILHYLTLDETVRSVEYIEKNIDTERYHIAIVDNCSANRTGVMLQNLYKENMKVTVIQNESNDGYAKGLNKGICFVREKFNCTFMVLMNNDIYLLDKFLFQKLCIEYQKSYFCVLGPMILSSDGRCNTNPYRDKMPDRTEIERTIKRYKKILKNNNQYKYKWFQLKEKLFGLVYNKMVNPPEKQVKNFWDRQEGIVIHGSIMILSPVYFEYFSGLDSNTFMYAEEYVLYLHLKENGLVEIYNPDIIVMHAGSSSVNIKASQEAFDKKYYLARHAVNSLIYVAEMMGKN